MMHAHKFLCLAIISVIALATTNHCPGGVLDGTHWKINVIPEKANPDKGEKAYDDTLVFVDGRFSSAALALKGFKPSPYRGEKEENEAEFEVEQVSQANGVVNWLGEVRGKQISGRLQWRKKNGASLSYNFTGVME